MDDFLLRKFQPLSDWFGKKSINRFELAKRVIELETVSYLVQRYYRIFHQGEQVTGWSVTWDIFILSLMYFLYWKQADRDVRTIGDKQKISITREKWGFLRSFIIFTNTIIFVLNIAVVLLGFVFEDNWTSNSAFMGSLWASFRGLIGEFFAIGLYLWACFPPPPNVTSKQTEQWWTFTPARQGAS